MKKLIILLAALSIMLALQAESPEKVSYQAIIRNTKGELVINQAIGMKISIYFYNKTTPVTSYAETQTPTTNENGLVSIEIGTGKVVTGVFADIDWASRAFYLKTEIDPGGRTSFSITSDTQILSVPYALHARTTAGIPDNSVSSVKIADNAVTIAKLPTGATATTYLRGDGIWATPAGSGINPWTVSEDNIYYNTGNVGIGSDKPAYKLHVETPVDGGTAIYCRSNSDTPGTRAIFGGSYAVAAGTSNNLSGSFAGVMGYTNWAKNYHYGVMGGRVDRDYGPSAGVIGLVDITNGAKPWGALGYQDEKLQEFAGYFEGKVKAEQVQTDGIITGPGNVSKEADLDVTGTIKLGSSGIVFSGIREITGMTSETSDYVQLKAGNNRVWVLGAEINIFYPEYNFWRGLGYRDNLDVEVPPIGYIVNDTGTVWLYYPDLPKYKNKPYRILIMDIQ